MIGLKNKKIFFIVDAVLIIFFVLMSSYSISAGLDGRTLTKDSADYFLMGYNLEKYGTLSIDYGDKPNPEPTAYREPVFPAYVAASIYLNPQLRAMDLKQMFYSQEATNMLRDSLIPLLIAIAFLTMYLTYQITGNALLAYFSLFIIGFSSAFAGNTRVFYSELTACLFLMLTTIFLHKVIRTEKIHHFVFLGIASGLLVLSRATFMYFIIFLVLFFILVLFKKKNINKRKFLAGTLIFIFLNSLIFGGWSFRNYKQFGNFFITNRGGLVLLIRAEKDTMSFKEYLSSFIYWAPGDRAKEFILNKFFNKNDYVRWDRDNPESFYMVATRDLAGIKHVSEFQIVDPVSRTLQKDKELRKLATDMILKHPFRHIFATIPFAWRGIFAEDGYTVITPFFKIALNSGYSCLILNLFFFFSLFYLSILSIKKKKWDIFAVFLPSLYIYAINSFLSHNRTRYTMPIIPILTIAALVFIFYLYQKRKKPKYPVI